MVSKFSASVVVLYIAVLSTFAAMSANGQSTQPLEGTLVVAVPVMDGVVVCSDKRLYNSDAGTFTDTSVKIRKVSDQALFAATNTVGFYDAKAGVLAFDAFEVTSRFAAKNSFSDSRKFWNGLRNEIVSGLRQYLTRRPFSEWPDSDRANNDLLFNLIFFSIDGDRVFSHTIRVFYKKARTPVIHASGAIREEVKTPKLSGKGTELVRYLAKNPQAADDPAIHQFDPSRFDARQTTHAGAIDFAGKLFRITSSALPQTHVSAAFDCASLSSQGGFRWVKQN